MRGSIRGYIVRADSGSPIRNATITIMRGPGPAPDIAPLTDSNGSFALEGLPAGDWHLQVRSPGGEIGEEVISVFDDSLTEITIRMRSGNERPTIHHGSIRGRVVRADNGSPIRDATITIMRDFPESALSTDAEGSFVLEGLPTGDWHLQVRSPGGEIGEEVIKVFDHSPIDATIRVKSGKERPIMHHGSIRGRVVRDNSEPVTDATIIIVRGPGPAPDIAPLTDSNGSFALEGLPAGDWHLQVRSPGGETGEQIVRVANDSPTNATIIVKPVKKQRSKH